MRINVIYFASLRDASEKSNESLDTTAQTVDELFEELNQKYSFSLKKDQLRVAINETYVEFNTQLNVNDTVVFIPPVAGG